MPPGVVIVAGVVISALAGWTLRSDRWFAAFVRSRRTMLGRDQEYNRSYLLRALWAFLAVGLSLLVSGIVIAST